MAVDKVALISGASRGIGASVAKTLYEAGWKVSLGMRTPKLPDWANPARVHVMEYDAADPEAATAWAEQARAALGPITAIVANAGIMIPKNVIEAEDSDFDDMFEVNVKAPRRLAKAAWDDLIACGAGRIIVLASLSGKRVKSAGSSSYSVSKFAAVALTHGFRQVGFDHGIRATAVCPGFVATDMAVSLTGKPTTEMTQPEDLAAAIAMLLALPNTASVTEFHVNCQAEEFF
ncbi:SDR family NAD(P)-dependent oxidoreductase [Salipiger sp. 1_MG-2023]|uniref:SDR family NAD(P)-dependent oxidoreductase n=1 Tax=Salipiger sp. 1_MG-2023 TaxID=3062665 RepID=UPI0026E42D84|nr:SDR family NAD(P)-dependent oxidoreductase [Salipiger sp. 1_MG-2023]MDO6584135.1 SDR family NAD(P)-dependent oxidoreductase [Salipiger sp. 1_MG-2023]